MKTAILYYQLIADLLDPASEAQEVIKVLENNTPRWEHFVYIGSNHLVIPTLYLQILRKGLSSYFPADLLAYMEEVTKTNRERNRAILDQIQRLSALFENHSITHVYLKGAAMLGGGYYADIAERMLRDIDILIAPEDQLRAYHLLKEQGYQEVVAGGLQYKTLNDYVKAKHLPAICHPEEIATVELHNHLHNTFQRERLYTPSVIREREERKIALPAPEDLLRHNIYNWHINDYGGVRMEIHFRSAYDTLVLLNKEQKLRPLLTRDRAARQYTNMLRIFFRRLPGHFDWRTSVTKAQLRNQKFSKFWFQVVFKGIRFIQILPSRLQLFTKSGAYRQRVFHVIQQGR